MSDFLRAPKKRGPVPIGEVIASLRNGLMGKGAREREAVASLWQKTVGKKKGAHAKIHALSGGTLTIWVDSASSLYEFSLEKESLLQKFKKELGPEQVKEIRFQLGSL